MAALQAGHSPADLQSWTVADLVQFAHFWLAQRGR
jgi:hypothetical protein